MISGDNPPKYCRWCGTRMPAPGMHEGSFKSETDCELEAVKSKLDEQVRLREMAESFLRTAIEINEKNTSRLATTELMLAQRNEQIAARIRELAAAAKGCNDCESRLRNTEEILEQFKFQRQSDKDRIEWFIAQLDIEQNETKKAQSRLSSVLETASQGLGHLSMTHSRAALQKIVELLSRDVERQLPECRNCGTPSSVLTNGWCDGCMGMARV
jgi:chromosome segregation ATPase